jgi:hypothetical protein
MPLQNRVTPWGDIVALPVRGLFMGNRGCLHDQGRRETKAWARLPAGLPGSAPSAHGPGPVHGIVLSG